jgi:hypothetical protein
VASKHGADWEGNNSLKRLILPFILTLEAEMQMAVNVFKLAGALILIGKHFIRVNSDLKF